MLRCFFEENTDSKPLFTVICFSCWFILADEVKEKKCILAICYNCRLMESYRQREEAFARFRAFVQAAKQDVDTRFRKRGSLPGLSPRVSENAVRKTDVTLRYVLTDETLNQIGVTWPNRRGSIGVGTGRMSIIAREGTNILLTYASDKTRTRFPDVTKMPPRPRSVSIRDRMSEGEGGSSKEVRRRLKAGESLDDIKASMHLRAQDLGSVRKSLRGEFDDEKLYLETQFVKNQRIASALRKLQTYEGPDRKEKLKELFAQMKFSLYKYNHSGPDPLFISVLSVAQEAGLRVAPGDVSGIALLLSSIKDIAVGKVYGRDKKKLIPNYFVFGPDRKLVIKALQDLPEFSVFRPGGNRKGVDVQSLLIAGAAIRKRGEILVENSGVGF